MATAEENLFMRSFNQTLDRYRCFLAMHGESTLLLPNENFDTGEPIQPGAYRLADNTYAKLVDKVSSKTISGELRANILAFYANLDAPFATKQDNARWVKLLGQLDSLKSLRDADSPKH